MAVPKRKISKERGRKRRTHYKHSLVRVGRCPNCGEPKQGFHACPSCGHYKDKPEIAIATQEVEEEA